jgi:hypothetical protein
MALSYWLNRLQPESVTIGTKDRAFFAWWGAGVERDDGGMMRKRCGERRSVEAFEGKGNGVS